MTYQRIAGTLNPGGHPGSYNGQDAYNDMLVTEDAIQDEIVHRGAKRLRPWTQAIIKAPAHGTERSVRY